MTQPGGDDDDVYSMTPDSEAILATRVPSSPSFWDPEIMNSRELFVIAEEDDEDWHSPSDSEGCSTPVSPLDLDRNNENQPQNYAVSIALFGRLALVADRLLKGFCFVPDFVPVDWLRFN
jgi:hypothetical protein